MLPLAMVRLTVMGQIAVKHRLSAYRSHRTPSREVANPICALGVPGRVTEYQR